MSVFISSFYNSKFKKAETVITPLRQNDEYTVDDMRAYIDSYVSVEMRMVNGIDSLNIMRVDGDFVLRSNSGVDVRVERK